MKTNAKKYLKYAAASILCIMASACKDDFNGNGNDIPDNGQENTEQYFLALRIYNAAAIQSGTRANSADSNDPVFDSYGNDYSTDTDKDGTNDKKFNTGLASENAIYNKYTKEEDCPNYLLVFGEDKAENSLKDKLEFLLPLFDWNYEKQGEAKDDYDNSTNTPNTTTGYTSYYTFYTSAEKYKLPASFDKRKVLIVVNASSAVKKELVNAYNAKKSFDEVLKIEMSQDPNKNKDEDYVFFTDSSDTKYFTMSSSMVIPKVNVEGAVTGIDTYGPAVIKRNFTWKKSKEEAVKEPIFSFFIERVQSKYTLTFTDTDGKKCYFTDDPKATEDEVYKPQQRIVISSLDINRQLDEEWKEIYYVKTYTRRNKNDKYGDDYIKGPEETKDDEMLITKGFMKKAKYFKINFTGWGINAIERKENLFKQISKFEYYLNWNPEVYSPYRNFWSVDPNYNATKYPDQFRGGQVVIYGKDDEENNSTAIKWADLRADSNIIPWESDMNETADYVDYFTYNQLANRVTHNYSPENTYDPLVRWSDTDTRDAANSSMAYMRAGTHVIITAQLLIEGMDDPKVCAANKFDNQGLAVESIEVGAVDKYYLNGVFFSDQAYREYVGEYLGYWMQNDEETFGPNDGILYVKNADETYTPATSRYFAIAPLYVKGGDGWARITPNLNVLFPNKNQDNLSQEDRDKQVVFYAFNPKAKENEVKYTEVTLKHFEILAMEHQEYFAQHFNAGRMYYAVPVSHNNTGGEVLFIGKYASVRNHWYNFSVTKISKIGTPVADPKDLIIPNKDHSYESLGLTLAVLPWHIVDASVDITGQRQPTEPDQIDIDLKIKANDWIYEGQEFGKNQGF